MPRSVFEVCEPYEQGLWLFGTESDAREWIRRYEDRENREREHRLIYALTDFKVIEREVRGIEDFDSDGYRNIEADVFGECAAATHEAPLV